MVSKFGSRRLLLLVGACLALLRLPFVYDGFVYAAPRGKLAQGRRAHLQSVQRRSRSSRRDSIDAYLKDYQRYVNNRMYITAAVRMIARQDLILSEADVYGSISVMDRPVVYGPSQKYLRAMEEELRQPRAKVMRDELKEAAAVIRNAITTELLAELETPEAIKERLKGVSLVDEHNWLGPDILDVESIIRMAVLCKGRDAFDVKEIESWLEEEERTVLSFFKVGMLDADEPSTAEGPDTEALEEFLKTIGPEFAGKAELILTATGVNDMEELLDLVEERADLADLEKDDVDMKVLHVKKLFKAIMKEKELRAAKLET